MPHDCGVESQYVLYICSPVPKKVPIMADWANVVLTLPKDGRMLRMLPTEAEEPPPPMLPDIPAARPHVPAAVPQQLGQPPPTTCSEPLLYASLDTVQLWIADNPGEVLDPSLDEKLTKFFL